MSYKTRKNKSLPVIIFLSDIIRAIVQWSTKKMFFSSKFTTKFYSLQSIKSTQTQICCKVWTFPKTNPQNRTIKDMHLLLHIPTKSPRKSKKRPHFLLHNSPGCDPNSLEKKNPTMLLCNSSFYKSNKFFFHTRTDFKNWVVKSTKFHILKPTFFCSSYQLQFIYFYTALPVFLLVYA